MLGKQEDWGSSPGQSVENVGTQGMWWGGVIPKKRTRGPIASIYPGGQQGDHTVKALHLEGRAGGGERDSPRISTRNPLEEGEEPGTSQA